uniref:Uncharacterized protein n=1 Tax=viral metagenome TaxID=1070528 RepID=A0A6H1ZPI6_9ZZZZ
MASEFLTLLDKPIAPTRKFNSEFATLLEPEEPKPLEPQQSESIKGVHKPTVIAPEPKPLEKPVDNIEYLDKISRLGMSAPSTKTIPRQAIRQAPEPSNWQKFKNLFVGEDSYTTAPPIDRMERVDKTIKRIARVPLRTFVKYGKGRLLNTPDLIWAGIKKMTPDNLWDEKVKKMNLTQAMDWAMGYNPSVATQFFGGVAEFAGGLKTAKGLVGTRKLPTGATALDKAFEIAKIAGVSKTAQELSKLTAEIIDPETDYQYEGAMGVARDMAIMAGFSLGNSLIVSPVLAKVAQSPIIKKIVEASDKVALNLAKKFPQTIDTFSKKPQEEFLREVEKYLHGRYGIDPKNFTSQQKAAANHIARAFSKRYMRAYANYMRKPAPDIVYAKQKPSVPKQITGGTARSSVIPPVVKQPVEGIKVSAKQPYEMTKGENIKIYNNIRKDIDKIVSPVLYTKEAIEKYLIQKYGQDPEIALYRGTTSTKRAKPFESDTTSKVGRYWTPALDYAKKYSEGGNVYKIVVKASDLIREGDLVSSKEVWLGEDLQKDPQVLAEYPELRKEAKPEKPQRNQFAQAHIVAKEIGIDKEEYQKIAQEITGKTSMIDMTPDEADQFIAELKTKNPPVIPAKITPQEITNPEIRKIVEKNQFIAGRKRKAHKVAVVKAESEGKEVNVINPLSSARYALAEAEAKTGVDLRQPYEGMNFAKNKVILESDKEIKERLKSVGESPFKIAMRPVNNQDIAKYLYEEDPVKRDVLRNKLDERSKNVAEQIDGILQGKAAQEIRERYWRNWDKADKIAQKKIKYLKKKKGLLSKKLIESNLTHIETVKPPNAPNSALAEGRRAKAEGRLKEWIKTQTWGTRARYYMSEAETDGLIEQMTELSVPMDIKAIRRAPSKPSTKISEAQRRRGKALPKGGSILNNVRIHLEKVSVANAIEDDLDVFWDNIKKADMSRDDIRRLQNFTKSILGTHETPVLPVKAARGANKIFWRFWLSNPIKGSWFAFRNSIQNIAYGQNQLPLQEWIKAGISMAKEKFTSAENQELEQAWIDDWLPAIRQKVAVQKQFLLQEEGTASKAISGRAAILLDGISGIPLYSDDFNRWSAWTLLFRASQNNVNLFKQGKISIGRLARRLRIDTMIQADELYNLLDKGDFLEFNKRIAKYKVENINFRYETALRSNIEQKPEGRLISGLITYQRGVVELTWQNSIKPMLEGWQSKNYSKAYQGFAGLVGLIIGMAAASKIVWEVAGKKAYTLLSTLWTPLAPGLGKVKDVADDISSLVYQYSQSKLTEKQVIDRATALAVNNTEFFLIGCDAMINYYENNNNVRGVRLWRLAKKEVLSKYFNVKDFNFPKANRSFHEKIQHQLFGGAEEHSIKEMTIPELRTAIYENTYKERYKRDGVWYPRGHSHEGKEDRVKELQTELSKR